MRNNINKRMNEMYLRDCFMAWFDVVLLFGAVVFVLIAILGIVQEPNIRLVLYISSAMLILFNTASVFAMTRHFKEGALKFEVQHFSKENVAWEIISN